MRCSGSGATLDDVERVSIENHVQTGRSILAAAGLEEEAVWVYHHHEHVDGSGYPDGIGGSAIPLESRVIRVADAFEAMTGSRPYSSARPPDDAFAELVRGVGTQFDATCVEALGPCARLGFGLLEPGESLRPAQLMKPMLQKPLKLPPPEAEDGRVHDRNLSLNRRTARPDGRARRLGPSRCGRLAAGHSRARPARAPARDREPHGRGDAHSGLRNHLDRAAEAARDEATARLLVLRFPGSPASASTPTSSARASAPRSA